MQRSKGDAKVERRIQYWDRAVAVGIKLGRVGRELSQDQVAQLMGWSPDVISNIEKNRRTVTLSELIVLAEAMGEDPAQILQRILQWQPPRPVAKGANARGAYE